MRCGGVVPKLGCVMAGPPPPEEAQARALQRVDLMKRNRVELSECGLPRLDPVGQEIAVGVDGVAQQLAHRLALVFGEVIHRAARRRHFARGALAGPHDERNDLS